LGIIEGDLERFLRESGLDRSNSISLVLNVDVELVVVVEQGKVLALGLVELLHHHVDYFSSSDLLDLFQTVLAFEKHSFLVFALL
jgi:hypothetical protein